MEFEIAFARLKVRVERACAAGGQADWETRLRAGIRAGFAFAAADPAAANCLTNDTLDSGEVGEENHERLMAYLVECLRPGRELQGKEKRPPEAIERAIAARMVAVVGQRLAYGEAEEMRMAGEEAVEFALARY